MFAAMSVPKEDWMVATVSVRFAITQVPAE
jgi:hypothetical protein